MSGHPGAVDSEGLGQVIRLDRQPVHHGSLCLGRKRYGPQLPWLPSLIICRAGGAWRTPADECLTCCAGVQSMAAGNGKMEQDER